jgi:hypothetical protein
VGLYPWDRVLMVMVILLVRLRGELSGSGGDHPAAVSDLTPRSHAQRWVGPHVGPPLPFQSVADRLARRGEAGHERDSAPSAPSRRVAGLH